MAASEQPPTTPIIALRPGSEPSTMVLALGGPIARSEVPRLCERVRGLLEGINAEMIICDVTAVVRPDLVTIDALARLLLTARRLGHRVWLRYPGAELQELLAFVGLSGALQVSAGLPVEPRGQIEEWEKVRSVEEEADPDDLTTR
ncbi:MAG TPA: STAS domain-containing protein [Actinomycetota bacterium]|nr:STAS domain-containing protein [Actinomycetota bacterium]